MISENATKQRRIYALLILSLVFLFNPNISVIDILPDFISYFLLARMFLFASDCAPYFEEARINFRRLGWLTFFKFFGLMIMVLVKRENASDNDIIPLVTFVFAILEAFFAFLAIKNIFDALFYLGNRSDALATITPFQFGKFKVRPETVRNLSLFFAIAKCAICFLPTPFLLTSSDIAAGGRISLAKSFTAVLIISNIFGIILGILWLCIIIKYVKAIRDEKQFYPTLEKLLHANTELNLEKKNKVRAMFSTFTVFTVASVFTIELSLVESYDVNVIPHFIYAAIMLLGVFRLARFTKRSQLTEMLGGLYLIASAAAYVVEYRFLTEYGYEALLSKEAARGAYPFVNLTAVIEFALLLAFLISLSVTLRDFITKNTGIADYGTDLKSNQSYYGALFRKNYILLAVGILAGGIKLLSVIMHGAVQVVFTDPEDVTQAVIVAPRIEWIGLAVTATALIYIGYTIYFFSTLKDEVKLKYEE